MARASRRSTSAVPASASAPLPEFVAPCLATRVAKAPDGDVWLHEIKFDGYRIQARLDHGEVRLLTRNRLDWTKRFGRIAQALATLKVETALLDGEIVVEREDGTTSFADLVADLKLGTSGRMAYYAFDILHLNGLDLSGIALVDRKTVMTRLLEGRRAGAIRLSGHITGDGGRMFAEACRLGLEGIISKRADAPYRSGRTGDWLKITCHLTDEFVIGGYVNSTAQRKAVGALVLGRYEKGRLRYVGRVGTGFTQETAASLWQIAQPLRVAAPPFVEKLDAVQRKGVTWLRPKLVAQIEYRAVTGDGLLRHAAFKGLREDKSAREAT